jgi:hypothetical protein
MSRLSVRWRQASRTSRVLIIAGAVIASRDLWMRGGA